MISALSSGVSVEKVKKNKSENRKFKALFGCPRIPGYCPNTLAFFFGEKFSITVWMTVLEF